MLAQPDHTDFSSGSRHQNLVTVTSFEIYISCSYQGNWIN